MDELNEMGVHVNNEGEFPVFTLGAKETACGPSVLVAGAPFLQLSSTAKLSTLTTLVGLSKYRTFKRCNLLVRHKKNVDAVTRQRPRRTGLAHALAGCCARAHALATQPTPPWY
jgi:hypothetical protein